LRALAEICAQIKYRTASPDPDDGTDQLLDRAVFVDTTFEGAGVICGDLTPECTAMVTAVLDALSAPRPVQQASGKRWVYAAVFLPCRVSLSFAATAPVARNSATASRATVAGSSIRSDIPCHAR
jgi:hypothetical protein